MDYFTKKKIITYLKDNSFEGDKYKQEQFELDYIFARSTLYQKDLPYFQNYSTFHPIVWGGSYTMPQWDWVIALSD